MGHPLRALAQTYFDLGNGSIVIQEDQCFCKAWDQGRGTRLESQAAGGMQWFAFAFSLSILCFYAYHAWKATCGWEEVYVCCVELTKVVIEFFHEFDMPAMLMLPNGSRVQWLRYGEWLLTCPVILIHLSNLTGLETDYSNRTMLLLVSDIGTIAMGITAAVSEGPPKIIFFILGCIYAVVTFYHAAMIYIEGYHTVPKGSCRTLVRAMAWVFFISWTAYPILFLLGHEGFGQLSTYGSIIGHTVIDLMSKNIWGLLGHHLRNKVYDHIALYGDNRRKIRVKLSWHEFEVMALHVEELPKTKERYAPRESFSVVIHDSLAGRAISGTNTGSTDMTTASCRMSGDAARKPICGGPGPRGSLSGMSGGGRGSMSGLASKHGSLSGMMTPPDAAEVPSHSCRMSIDVPRKVAAGGTGAASGARMSASGASDVGPMSNSARLSVDVPRKTTANGFIITSARPSASGMIPASRRSSLGGMADMETRVTSARLSVDGPRKIKTTSVVPAVDVDAGSSVSSPKPKSVASASVAPPSRLSTPLGANASRHSNPCWEEDLVAESASP